MDIRATVLAWRGAWRPGGWLSLILLCAGCAGGPADDEFRRAAGSQPSFAEISAAPRLFLGRTVLLGGEVARARFEPPVTEWEVWQVPLDDSGRPAENGASSGRFLVRCPGFPRPADLAPGQPITVAGEIEGEALRDAEIRPLGPFRYLYPAARYPVIACRQIRGWPSRREALERYAAPYGVGPRWWRWPGYAHPYNYRPFR
jgi:outer membrane lipoprotein